MRHDEADRDRIRDELPDWIGGHLDEARAEVVGRAVEADPDLAAEAAILRSVAANRAEVPEGLDVRITAAVLRERRGSSTGAASERRSALRRRRLGVPTWSVAAAAGLVLALGTIEIVDRTSRPGRPTELDALVSALESPHSPWVADDGTVAGAAVLDGLTEEALTSLLEEMGG